MVYYKEGLFALNLGIQNKYIHEGNYIDVIVLFTRRVLYLLDALPLVNSPVMVCPFEFVFLKLFPFGKCCQQVIEDVEVSLFPKNTSNDLFIQRK